MAWVDADYHGALSAADPVWGELKIWRVGNQKPRELQRRYENGSCLGPNLLGCGNKRYLNRGKTLQNVRLGELETE
jgi:hypothetical protein